MRRRKDYTSAVEEQKHHEVRDESEGNKPQDFVMIATARPEDLGIVLTASTKKAWQIRIPIIYREAMTLPEKDFWLDAMKNQLAKLHEAKAYEVIPYPSEPIRILPGKWVFDVKSDSYGFITQYRACWVICGNRQKPGIDYDTSYAPVVTDQAIKLLFCKAAKESIKLRQFNIVTIYLND